MLVTSIEQLPTDLPEFVLDVETTSFDDKLPAFNPWEGCRIAGIALGTLEGDHTWYIPYRHHSGAQNASEENLPLEPVQRWLRDLFKKAERYVNHNIKFDQRFIHFEGADVFAPKRNECTMALARLVHNDLPQYSLEFLGQKYCGEGKAPLAIKAYLKSIKSKDFGRVPPRVMGKYAEQDARLTALLRLKLLEKLPSCSLPMWDIECAATTELLRNEIEGVRLDVTLMKTTQLRILRRLLELNSAINEIAGREIDPGKESELTAFLIGDLGIEPKAYTATGLPQWNKMAFVQMEHPVGPLLAEYTTLIHHMHTFLEGWLKRTHEGFLHPDWRQAGTKTGRLSSKNPNMQNIPPEAEVYLLPYNDDDVIITFDYSQIEYRIFGHYTQEPAIMDAYLKNKDTDFHGMLADILGVERQFAKSLNFAFIYGMGEKKLLDSLAGLLSIRADDENLKEKLRAYTYASTLKIAERAKQLDLSDFLQIAKNIYNEYHKKFPSIKKFSRAVYGAGRRRGWVRNLLGRVYQVPRVAPHKAVNWLIQGSAADVFKERLFVGTLPDVRAKFGARMIANVHDEIAFSVPREAAVEFYDYAERSLEDFELRIPLYVSGKASGASWGHSVKVNGSEEIEVAVKKSREIDGPTVFELEKGVTNIAAVS